MIDQQLYIDGTLADISEKTEVTLTHVSNVLNGASSFNANHSLTVTIPATAHNRKLFDFPDIVQFDSNAPYVFHSADYHRDGLPVISGGRTSVVEVTSDEIQLVIVWGMKRVVDTLFGGNDKLVDLETEASIEFYEEPHLTPYATAADPTTEVFYAALDTTRHEDLMSTYHMTVKFQSRSWNTSGTDPATPYLHPSVRMDWLLAQIEAKHNVTIDFVDPYNEIPKMIVPLITKIPNDTTFNGGYMAHASEPSSWGTGGTNAINLETQNTSFIIKPQANPPESFLIANIGFSGILRFSIYMYIDNLVQVAYPVYRSKYGYRLDVNLFGGETHSCVIIPESTTFMVQEMNNGRVGFTINGSLPIEVEANQRITLRLTCINNGEADYDLGDGIHVYGGNVWINNITGEVNEVQPTQLYPVQGNLPDIKFVDLIKFLCAVTGAFPVQASTEDTLVLSQVSELFDWSRAVDWSDKLLSVSDIAVAAKTGFTPDGWAQKNWFRWKEDDTVSGDYDGSIDVDDETIDKERNIITFPFAATDGNIVPMYVSDDGKTKWKKVSPRVLHMRSGLNDAAEGYFGFFMSRIISTYYYDLQATMQRPVYIEETVLMSDLEFMSLDETKPIWLKQHNGYFALLSCELHQNGTAKAKLLKLKKMEEI